MSEDAAPYGIARPVTDGAWSICAVVDPGPPECFTVVVEQAGAVAEAKARAMIVRQRAATID